ncbi:TLC domain-containing protein 3A-like [Glandiceps talaboti]
MSWIFPFLLGCVFFPGCYWLIRSISAPYCKRFTNSDVVSSTIAEKLVSIIQAILAFICGLIIVQSCTNDVMYDSHWLVNSYISFGLPYMLYDIYAMYVVYMYKNPHLQREKFTNAVISFTKAHPAMILHHLALALLGYPVIMFFRNGKGDFFVGCFFFTELANPFIHIRAILKQIGWHNTNLSTINGVFLLASFFLCRLLLFPLIYNIYGRTKNLSLLEVPSAIPVKCNIGCGMILAFQIYWFYLILGAARRQIEKILLKFKRNSQERY